MIAVLSFAVVASFAKIMTMELNHNEHMYHAASVFVSQSQTLYKDFAYVQTPYLPLLYGTAFSLMGLDSHYLLAGKFFSFFFLMVSALILFLIGRRVLSDVVMALGIVVLFLLNLTILRLASEISNYIMPVAFSFISFYLFSGALENRKPLTAGLAGLFAAFAIGAKLTYAGIMVPFFVATIVHPLIGKSTLLTLKKSVVSVLVPFSIGAIIGFAPMLPFVADFEAFFFNNLGYHHLNTEWRELTNYTRPMSPYAKIFYAHMILLQPDNLILLLGLLFGLAFSFENLADAKRDIKQLPVGAFLAALLFLIAVPTALVPTPSFFQYYAIPISFLFLLLIYAFAPKTAAMTAFCRRCLLALVVATLAYHGPHLLRVSFDLTNRDGWLGFRVHDIAAQVRTAIADNGADISRPVATLSPIFALELNLQIYSEFSTGPFTYRIGDLLTPEQRKHFVGTSQKHVKELLSSNPPSAIIVGFEKELDDPLMEFGKMNSYKLVEIPGFDGKVFVRPAAITEAKNPLKPSAID
jgi:hypothetical protein